MHVRAAGSGPGGGTWPCACSLPQATTPAPCRGDRDRRSGLTAPCAAGNTHLIEVRCLTQNYGYFPVTLLFEFTADETGPFSTGRFVSAVANSRLAEELGPTAPYTPYQDGLQKPLTVLTEEGVPPDRYRCARSAPAPLLAHGLVTPARPSKRPGSSQPLMQMALTSSSSKRL